MPSSLPPTWAPELLARAYYSDDSVVLVHGDCLDVLRTLPDASVDSVVTDPPYGLGFMGREWDALPPGREWAEECLRVLKPGGHLLAFGGTRTWHRLACAVEDAGFEVRDSIAWMYGSGFPKSLDVSKAIDKAAGAEREVVGTRTTRDLGRHGRIKGDMLVGTYEGPAEVNITAPATPDAAKWAGFGTALKPGHEPVVCARKPFNTVPLGEEVDRLHHLIGGLLWLSLSPAKRAELASPSSPAGQHGARCASALVSAATATSPDGFAQTGMCSSPATASTSSSIASSWSSILGALSALTSTSTTSTRSSTTTALTTLSSLLAPLTSPSTMPPCACLTSGSSSSAPSAGSDSTDEWARWLHTLSASVPASAIEGTALVVASALAQVAASLSADQGAASSADPSATTGADASPSPAFEPVVVARKPLIGTVAATVLAHGTGALNIDGCRIGDGGGTTKGNPPKGESNGIYGNGINGACDIVDLGKGRWPANVVLDESQAEALDEQSGTQRDGVAVKRNGRTEAAEGWGNIGKAAVGTPDETYGGQGGASRFFPTFRYEAKAPTSERPRYKREGGSDNATTYGQMKKRECNVCGNRTCPAGGEQSGKPWPTCGHDDWSWVEQQSARDEFVAHPTVKPLSLMRWLVRLVTPPGGTVLEPFAGSGTTVEACIVEGFQCIAIEREADYLPLIRQRIDRRRYPVEALRGQAADLGLFDLLGGEGA